MTPTLALPAAVTTPRLSLRRWTLDDAAALSAAVEESLDHLRPWMSWAGDEPLSAEARAELIRRFEESWESGVEVVFGAFLGEVVVGGCGLMTRAGGAALEIGYWVHVDRLRQGFATEMAAGLVDAAFTVDGVETVEIHHDRANAASRAVPAGLGFSFQGERRDVAAAPAEVGLDCSWVVRRADWLSSADRRR